LAATPSEIAGLGKDIDFYVGKSEVEKGGPGSGHWGHKGRKGERGGSAPSGAAATTAPRSVSSQKDYVTSLPKSQMQAVRGYVMGDYKDINAHLREGIDSEEMDVRAAIESMDAAMASAPPLKNATLYRAMVKSPDEIGMSVGEVWQDKGFTSTTKSAAYMYKELADLKTRVQIKLPKKVRQSVRGLEVFNMDLPKRQKKEQEILLDRSTSFSIRSIEKAGMYTNVVMEIVE